MRRTFLHLSPVAVAIVCSDDRERVHKPAVHWASIFKQITEIHADTAASCVEDFVIFHPRDERRARQPFYRQLKKYRKPTL